MSLQPVPRVARGEQALDAFAQSPRFAGKLNTIYSVWHHDIAKQEIKFLATLEHLDRLRTIPGAKNPIAERVQHCRCDVQEILIVINHQDSLRASRYGLLRLDSFHLGIRLLRGF